MASNLQQMHLKLPQKKVIQKTSVGDGDLITAVAAGDLIGNKIADKIKGGSKTLQQNHPETVRNDNDKKIPKERYISPEEKQKIIDDLRLI